MAEDAAEQDGENLRGRQRLAEIAETLDGDHFGRPQANARGKSAEHRGVETSFAAHVVVLIIMQRSRLSLA